MNWKEAIEFCDEILESLDDLPDAAEDFAEGVNERVTSMREWIVDNEHVTPKMVKALENISDGIAKWHH